MKTKYITIGVDESDAHQASKYRAGKCKIRVLVLNGTPEQVAQAEKCRRDQLRQEVQRLYSLYMDCSFKELDMLFSCYHVTCLTELLEVRVHQKLFVMLSYPSAEQVLHICQSEFCSSLEMSVNPGFPYLNPNGSDE